MQLNIKDRIYVPQLLLPQNNFLDFTIKKGIIEKVKLVESDKEKYSIKEEEGGRVTWNVDAYIKFPLEVTFTDQELEYLKRSCESLAESVYPDDLWITVEKIYNECNLQ